MSVRTGSWYSTHDVCIARRTVQVALMDSSFSSVSWSLVDYLYLFQECQVRDAKFLEDGKQVESYVDFVNRRWVGGASWRGNRVRVRSINYLVVFLKIPFIVLVWLPSSTQKSSSDDVARLHAFLLLILDSWCGLVIASTKLTGLARRVLL